MTAVAALKNYDCKTGSEFCGDVAVGDRNAAQCSYIGQGSCLTTLVSVSGSFDISFVEDGHILAIAAVAVFIRLPGCGILGS